VYRDEKPFVSQVRSKTRQTSACRKGAEKGRWKRVETPEYRGRGGAKGVTGEKRERKREREEDRGVGG